VINVSSAILWGFLATIALTALVRAGQAFGFTRIDLPLILGMMFTADRDRAKIYGSLLHAMNGWFFAVVYAWIFEAVHLATWWNGALLGLLHGAGVLTVVMPLLPGMHPRMASDYASPDADNSLEPPGFFALNYGYRTPIATLAAHVVYGIILGSFYSLRR
jgi:hypothetical protein